MTHLERSLASLRIMGENLLPEEITTLLGCNPTTSHAKGDVVRGSKTGIEYTKKIGMWRLCASNRQPENLDHQVEELLGQLSQDLNTWAVISNRFEMDLFCGLFMGTTNEGCSISANTLKALGERGIELSLDIYAPTEDLRLDDLCPCESGKTYAECCMPQA